MSKIIKGIKLIKHNAAGVNEPDDTSFPWRLDMFLRPPEFMSMDFMMMHHGGEEICVRGQTEQALEEFATVNNLFNHPRKTSLKIWQPETVNA